MKKVLKIFQITLIKNMEKMNKTVLLLPLILLFSLFSVYAHGEETFSQAEEIIKQKITCSGLSYDQLEILGDYYMEQMHPGEAHEIMDDMMGGEGSESLRLMHVNMGLTFYCGEHESMSRGMMDMMMGRTGMTDSENMMGTSGNYGVFGMGFFGWLFMTLILVALVLLIVWFIKQIQK